MKRAGLLLMIFWLNVWPTAYAHPLDEITYGAEFTFFDPATMKSDGWERIIERMKNHLVEGQPDGAKFTVLGKNFQSPNGWSYVIGLDPGVTEIRTSPATVETWKRYKGDIQDAIFVSAANEGFFPALFQGGGHINIGTAVLFQHPLLLRNFIVDLMNHNELFLGVLDYNNKASPSLCFRPKRTQEDIRDFIKRFDNGEFQGVEGILRFMTRLRIKMGAKYAAISLVNVNLTRLSRIELRAVRPQASMDVWVKQIDLISHRLKYLFNLKNRLPLAYKVPVQNFDPTARPLNPPVNPQDALKAFYAYVTESGLRWQDYTEMLWPKWVTDGEVTKFENSQWFKEREARVCELALSA